MKKRTGTDGQRLLTRRESTSLSKRNGDGIAFRKRSKSSAIPGVGAFRHYFPNLRSTCMQDACPWSPCSGTTFVSSTSPSKVLPYVKDFTFIWHLLAPFFLAPFPFKKIGLPGSLPRGAKILRCILGEQIAN